MKQLQPVIWTKGTFLTPQHMQVQDRFIEDSLSFRLQSLKYCPWGFTELSIDQERLADGQLLATHAAGIFADGLLFDIPDADPAPPSKSIADFFEPGVNNVDVFLAVPDYRQRGMNVSNVQRNGNTRFVADVSSFRDENNGISEKPIQIARKNLRFLAGSENRQGYSVLRIANIEKTETGAFRTNPHFVPPLLSINASKYLVGIIRGLIEVLSAKSSQLSATRRQKNQSLADFSASDIANFWLLYTVNAHFPAFNHIFAAKNEHPQRLYSAMTALAGSLTTFSANMHPRDLPAYDHDQLGPIFTDLEERIRTLLETVVPTNVVSLPLKRVQNFIYATALNDEKYLASTRMFLAMAADAREEDIIRKAPQLLKVGTGSQVEQMIKQALPGIQLRHLPSPPAAIPVKLKYQYFSLNQSGEAWEAVRRARNLAAFVPGDFPGPELELLILLPQAK